MRGRILLHIIPAEAWAGGGSPHRQDNHPMQSMPKVIDNSWVFMDSKASEGRAVAERGADEYIQSMREKQRSARTCMFSPLAPWRLRWELVLNVFIMYQVVMIPFELTYLERALIHEHGAWLALEVFMVIAFLIDMALNFRTGVALRDAVDYDRRRAALAYARGRFMLDFVAWLPSVLGLLADEQEAVDDGRTTAMARLARSFRFVRLLRAMRVLQIVRLARLTSMLHEVQLRLHERRDLLRLVQGGYVMLATLLCMHLIACLWAAVALESHIASFQQVDLAESLGVRYAFGLWWASSALTVGGPVPPNSSGEMVLATFVSLCSVFLFGAVLTWCFDFVSSLREDRSNLASSLKAAAKFASLHDLPKELRTEMRSAIYHSQKERQIRRDFKELVESSLSGSLQRKIYGSVYHDMLRRFPAFSERAPQCYPGCEAVGTQFLWQLAYEATLTSYQPEERVATIGEKAESMGFITEGRLLMFGPSLPRSQVLQRGWWFGEKTVVFDRLKRNKGGNTFFVSSTPTRTANLVALQHSAVLELRKDSIMEAVEHYGLKETWLEPLAAGIKMKAATLGCSCCLDVGHSVLDCPEPRAGVRYLQPEHKPRRSRGPPPRPRWLPTAGPRNTDVLPERWGMRLDQWAAFILACCFSNGWDELEQSVEKDKEPGHVNLYQVCNNMVKPWTRDTGSSVALLMNAAQPLNAQVMISHAWSESVLETLVAVLGQASLKGLSKDTVIWFCTFAQYQAGDLDGDCGPTVQEQLAMDPFRRVIAAMPVHGMLVVHTSTVELYSRLWCVYEVNEALEKNLPTTPAYSMGALQELFGDREGSKDLQAAVAVDTSKAACGNTEDTQMITKKVKEAGGFKVLDGRIASFRMATVKVFDEMFTSFTAWAADGTNKDDVFEGLTELVAKAAIFVGLRYLLPYAEQVKDEELIRTIEGMAKDILELWRAAFRGFEKLPPGITASDMPSAWEDIRTCLLDEAKVPLARRLLEMSAGGVGRMTTPRA